MGASPPPLPSGPIPTTAHKAKATKTKKKSKPVKPNPQKSKKDDDDNNDNDKNAYDDTDDGWEHFYDDNSQRYFFYNNITKLKQWFNPRIPADHEFNQNLPTYPPPELPHEEEPNDEYTKKLKLLKDDPEFNKLSSFEKYQRAKRLKEEFESEELSKIFGKPTITSTELEIELKDPVLKDDDNKKLNNEVSNHRCSHNSVKTKHKITKNQIKHYNERKKQQREQRLKNWLTKD